MNEQERAEWLARAVDNLIQRGKQADPPPELDDGDLQGILNIARARLESAETASHAGLQYEGAVWKRVLERLEGRVQQAPDPTGHGRASAGTNESVLDDELGELQDIIGLRKRMAEEVLAFAETQREAVWQNVHSRIQARSRSRGLLSFLTRRRREGELQQPALDGIAVGQTVWQSSESRTDELVALARKRRVLAQMAEDASSTSQRRVWSRVKPSIYGVTVRDARRQAAGRPAWTRIAAAGAAAGLLIAAVGPIPATGFAGHPAVRVAEYVRDHVGVSETSSPPAESGAGATFQGTPVSASQAGELLGIPVSEPTALPQGFSLAASGYFAGGLTSESGAFVLTYTSDDGTLLIIQEAAGGPDMAAGTGAVEDIALPDGTPASYVRGGWLPGANGLTWSPGDLQTIVFDRDGVRTTVQYSGPAISLADLIEVAGSIG